VKTRNSPKVDYVLKTEHSIEKPKNTIMFSKPTPLINEAPV